MSTIYRTYYIKKKTNSIRNVSSKEKMNFIYNININDVFFKPIYFLNFIGFWNDEKSNFQKITSNLFTFVCILSTVAHSIFNFIDDEKTWLLLGFKLVNAFHHAIIAIVKFHLVNIKKESIFQLLANCLHNNISAPKILVTQIYHFDNRFKKYNKALVKIVTILVLLILYTPIYIFIYMYTEVKWDVKSILSFITQGLGTVFLINVTLSYSLIYITLMLTLCKILDHMNDVILTLRNATHRELSDCNENISKKLKYIVQTHQRAIRFADGINEIFSYNALLDMCLALALVIVSVIDFKSSNLFPYLNVHAFYVLMDFCTSVLLAIYCYFGSMVIEKSGKKIAENFNSYQRQNWNSDNQQITKIILIRVRFPIRILAGQIFTISNKTLAMLAGYAASYTIIFFQIQIKHKNTDTTIEQNSTVDAIVFK
ncbi:Odorant receptor 2 [Ephemera danica]|nr:Odorant receptor 2 [Ephemera danica]